MTRSAIACLNRVSFWFSGLSFNAPTPERDQSKGYDGPFK